MLTEHAVLEIDGQNVVGMKDKDIAKVIEDAPATVTVTIMPGGWCHEFTTKVISTDWTNWISCHDLTEYLSKIFSFPRFYFQAHDEAHERPFGSQQNGPFRTGCLTTPYSLLICIYIWFLGSVFHSSATKRKKKNDSVHPISVILPAHARCRANYFLI